MISSWTDAALILMYGGVVVAGAGGQPCDVDGVAVAGGGDQRCDGVVGT